MAISDLFGNFLGGGSGSGLWGLILTVVIAGGALLLVGGTIFWLVHKKRKWFLIVEIKIPRSDGKFINSEIGKGSYDANRGVVFIKRKGKKPVPMKPFDIKRFLQGQNILTVVQVGIEDYRPVLTESYMEMEDDETGEVGALLKAKIDTSESKSWRNNFERETKNAYSIMGLIKEHFQMIALGLVIFLWGIQFLVIYNAVK